MMTPLRRAERWVESREAVVIPWFGRWLLAERLMAQSAIGDGQGLAFDLFSCEYPTFPAGIG
jgi:hypothetical protein